ncbi:MAG: hypothetical protein EBR09_08265 [Proteobacteria bacterium]|nr:hypothetical protein [Pseudomonadota bacterium]
MKNMLLPFTACAVLGAVLVSGQAYGFRKFLDQFSEHYDANSVTTHMLTDETSCGLCHVRAGGGGKRTPYGEDFLTIALDEGKGFPGIEFTDSDKDGYVNLEEIFLQTHPGKPEIAPAGRIELSLKDAGTLSVAVAAECALMDLKAFGFKFESGASDLQLKNVKGTAEVKVSGTQGAVLAKCDAEKLTGNLMR